VILDNRQLKTWPEVTVVVVLAVDNLMADTEPFAQKVTLSCGHWLINTYGDKFRPFDAGAKLRCRSCALAHAREHRKVTRGKGRR